MNTDVLVVGSGGAGCAAALEAHKAGVQVTLICAQAFKQSSTARAQGGIQAAMDAEDSWKTHAEDTLRAGEFCGNSQLVEFMARSAPETIDWLQSHGVVFDTDETGSLKLSSAGGLSHPRILSCGDNSGNRIMGPLEEAVRTAGIQVIEQAYLDSVGVSDDLVATVTVTGHAEPMSVSCNALVIATGSGRSVRGAPSLLDSADKMGLETRGRDLIQEHPTGVLEPTQLQGRPAPEGLRAIGAHLTNNVGNKFVDPLLTRKALCAAIRKECDEGRGVVSKDGQIGVWLHTEAIDANNGKGYTAAHYGSFYGAAMDAGVDITKSPVLVYPVPHYLLGGIVIDCKARTSRTGIFAAGEVTWGVHGADRLMGNSLLDIFVFGRVAGSGAAAYVTEKQTERMTKHG